MGPSTTKTIFTAQFSGEFRLEDQDNLSLLPKSKKARCILAFCVYKAGTRVPREALANLCWPDRQRQQALGSLRQALLEIKTSLGRHADGFLEIGRDFVEVNGEAINNDLNALREGAITPVENDILGGLDYVSPEFDDWLRLERRNIVVAAQRSAEIRLGAADPLSDEALDAALRILAIEPENEAAARAAMKSYAARGENSKVAGVYQRLLEVAEALGFGVSQRTETLYQQLRRAENTAGTTGHNVSVHRGGLPTLLVLPVQTADPQPGAAGLAQRLSIELQARAAEIREWRPMVFQPSATGGPSNETGSVPGQVDGADYAVGGSIFPDEERAQVVIQLSKVESGELLRTIRTNTPLDAPNDAMQESVEDIVAAALPAIEQVECSELLHGDPDEWSAYQCYLKAKELIVSSVDTNYMELAEPHLERAVALDPSYTPPYSYLIGSYNSGRKMTAPGLSRRVGNSRAMALCRQFLLNDAQNPNAHLSMAWCLLRLRKFDEAECSLDEAVRLKLYDPNRINALGTAFVYLGHAEKGLHHYDVAKRRMVHNLDFMSTDYGEAYYFLQEFERALSFLDVEELRNPLRSHILRCATLGQLGRLVEAQAAAEQAVAIFRQRWRGDEAFSAKAAVEWYIEGFPLRRRQDMATLVEGLAKGGFVF